MAGNETLTPYFSEIARESLVDAETECELARRACAGDAEARNELARANLRLVVHFAKRFQRRGLPLEDLIAEGNVGLMRAIDKFDPERGIRFATYANWWIRQAIGRALEYAPAVRVPSKAQSDVVRPSRLDGDGRDAVFGGLEVDAAMGPDRIVEETEHHQVAGLLTGLDERQRRIVQLRFGLDGAEPKTLLQIGRVIGLTRERIRQLLNESLAALRDLAIRRDTPRPALARVA